MNPPFRRRVRPHPNPLAQGEGTAAEPRRMFGSSLGQAPRRMVHPLPGGEGWGEGELETQQGTGCAVLLAGIAPERHVTPLRDAGFDHVLFLDAVEFGGVPGSVVFLNTDEMGTRFPQVSTHKLSLGLLGRWIESNGVTRVWLLGVQPASCRAGTGLSSPVRRTIGLLAELLAELGKSAIQAIPNFCCEECPC